MLRSAKRRIALAMCAVGAAVVVLLAATPANAQWILLQGHPGQVTGVAFVQNDKTEWTLGLTDEEPEAWCVYIKINIDIRHGSDKQHYSEMLCNAGTGESLEFHSTGVTYDNTRGARIYHCYLQANIHEVCGIHNVYVPEFNIIPVP